MAAGHVTNYAQNENGNVWDLQQLKQHLGVERWTVGGCGRCLQKVPHT